MISAAAGTGPCLSFARVEDDSDDCMDDHSSGCFGDSEAVPSTSGACESMPALDVQSIATAAPAAGLPSDQWLAASPPGEQRRVLVDAMIRQSPEPWPPDLEKRAHEEIGRAHV